MMSADRIKMISLGSFIGLSAPWISMYLYKMYHFSGQAFDVFLHRLWVSSLFPSMLSLAALVNLLSFFLFIWLNRDEAARGVLFATFLYAFVVFIFRIFG